MTSHNDGLELDIRHSGVQSVQEEHSLPEAYQRTVGPLGKAEERPNSTARSEPQNLIFGLRSITFWLIVGLVMGWVLAIVAAAVGGSIAVHRMHELSLAYVP